LNTLSEFVNDNIGIHGFKADIFQGVYHVDVGVIISFTFNLDAIFLAVYNM